MNNKTSGTRSDKVIKQTSPEWWLW